MTCRYQTAICVEEPSEDPRFRDLCATHAVILGELLQEHTETTANPHDQELEEADAAR